MENTEMLSELAVFAIYLTAIFLIILLILWFILPFAIFGIKDLLKQQNQKLDRIISLLSEINTTKNTQQQKPSTDKSESFRVEKKMILSTVRCKGCGNQIKQTDEFCPHCQFPQ